ncbi:hypothetical protein QEN19_000744 [Hanseniaspora menglaensis]
MNSLKAEPNPFEQSFKIKTRESISSVPSVSKLDAEANTSTMKSDPSIYQGATSNTLLHQHDAALNSHIMSVTANNPTLGVEGVVSNPLNTADILGSEHTSNVPTSGLAMNDESGSVSLVGSVFESLHSSTKNDHPTKSPSDGLENSHDDVVPVAFNQHIAESNVQSGTINAIENINKASGIISPRINNSLPDNKKFMNMPFLRENLSAGGASNANLSPWPFGAAQSSNLTPGLTTPGGRRIDFFTNNIPFLQPANNANHTQNPYGNQALLNIKAGSNKVKLTPGPGNTVIFQRNPLSPQDEFSKQLMLNQTQLQPTPTNSSNKLMQPHQQIQHQPSTIIPSLHPERIAASNGMSSPVPFLNIMGLNNPMVPNFSFSGMNTPFGSVKTGLTPKILQQSNLGSRALSNPNGNVREVENTLDAKKETELDVVNGLSLVEELKKNADHAPQHAKKRGRKPGSGSSKTVKKLKTESLESMTITDIKNHPEMTEEEKRKGILEKNRVAAYNFRLRKKEFVKTLEHKVDFYEKEYNETSNLYRTILGGAGGDRSLGLLVQLKNLLANSEIAQNSAAISLVDEIINNIHQTSYYQRHGANPFDDFENAKM